MVVILQVLDCHKTAEIDLLVKVSFSDHDRLYRIAIFTLEHMLVNDVCMLEITGLILPCRVLIADIDHAIIVADCKTGAVYIEPLSELVLIVKAVLSDLYLDSGCLVLDVKALVKVADLVGCGHLAFDHAVLLHHIRLVAVLGIHRLHISDGCELSEVCVSIDVLLLGIRIFACEHRLELLASCEERRCSND